MNWLQKLGPPWSRTMGQGVDVQNQEGQTGNGRDFLVMHRAMLEFLKKTFKGCFDFEGWNTPPQDEAAFQQVFPQVKPSDFPTGGSGSGSFSATFSPDMAKAIANMADATFIQTTFCNQPSPDDAYGLYVETSLRAGRLRIRKALRRTPRSACTTTSTTGSPIRRAPSTWATPPQRTPRQPDLLAAPRVDRRAVVGRPERVQRDQCGLPGVPHR